MSKPNIIEMKGNLGGFRLLGKTPDGTCAECAVAHPPEAPHNQQSMHWQYRFRERRGRWPTWHDAMRHCEPEVRQRWLDELAKLGMDVGVDPVRVSHESVKAMIELGTRALSVRQPWAWLIVNGFKPFENRDWSLKNPARKWLEKMLAQCPDGVTTLIHAAQGMTADEHATARAHADEHHITLPLRDELERGGIVGAVNMVRWHDQRTTLAFSFGSGIEMANAHPREFLPCKGALGFFKPEIYRTQGIGDFVTEVKP